MPVLDVVDPACLRDPHAVKPELQLADSAEGRCLDNAQRPTASRTTNKKYCSVQHTDSPARGVRRCGNRQTPCVLVTLLSRGSSLLGSDAAIFTGRRVLWLQPPRRPRQQS